jgi:hypothetical protein
MIRTTIAATLVLLAAAALAAPLTKWRTVSDDRRGLYRLKASYPVFTADSPVARLANHAYRQAAQQATAQVRQEAIADAPRRRRLGAPMGYALDLRGHTSLVGERLLCGYLTDFRFTGGAHPSTNYLPMNFALVGGKAKRLVLKDLLARDASAAKLTVDAVLPELNRIKRGRGADPAVSLDPGLLDKFVVTANGITWLFAPGDAGAYAEGSYLVKVPWSRLEGLLRAAGPLQPLLAK